MASEKMLHAVESFSSLFVPFYFFHAGLRLRPRPAPGAVLAGAAFGPGAAAAAPWVVVLHRRLALGEPWRAGLRVGVPMLPTLVFRW